ncbi:hypothetical protein SLEP1_g20580 [Rubroshorea leprosula]|uniref:Uncharacterized protein n=1 Tax=Rubroshorea leprosula TaxID=152421 RepID=A0AAV5JDS7_9ROSI|nr:hypothetical protein SLEP1_g20580 [Rubroshorea leprosula]
MHVFDFLHFCNTPKFCDILALSEDLCERKYGFGT